MPTAIPARQCSAVRTLRPRLNVTIGAGVTVTKKREAVKKVLLDFFQKIAGVERAEPFPRLLPSVLPKLSTALPLITERAQHPKNNPKNKRPGVNRAFHDADKNYLSASSTATAQATVAPTIGLLPMPMRPIISTCAGTEEEPANWALEWTRPRVSVRP